MKAAPARDSEPEYFDGTHIERRTKAVSAGPWEPVEENGENTPNRTIGTEEGRND